MIVSLKKAAEMIKSGEVIAFPTETVYGLGADAKNIIAIKKTFDLKGRPADNPLIVHISNLSQLDGLVSELPKYFHQLSEAFWPGPISFILKKDNSVPDLVTGGLSTVAVRMPDHPLALSLIEITGPLTAPSANKSGKPSPTRPEHIVTDFGDSLPMLDGEPSKIGLESTVIDLSSDIPAIYRPGAISKEMVEDVLKIDVIDSTETKPDNHPKSPGLKYSHYKPNADVNWLEGMPSSPDSKSYYLTHSSTDGSASKNLISFNGDFDEMAKSLYDHFRTADYLGYSQIWVEKLPENLTHPLIAPLKNRVQKAISH